MGESTAAAYVIDVLSTLVAMEYMDHGFDKKYSGAARIMLFTGGCLAYMESWSCSTVILSLKDSWELAMAWY